MSAKKSGSATRLVYDFAKPLCDELGLDLWDVTFEKEGATWYLRVFIDKDGGVNIDDCEAISRPLNKMLDETDPIDQAYTFEVGSAGLERELKKPEHFDKYIGKAVKAKLFHTENGNSTVKGKLNSYSKDTVILEADNGEQQTLKLSECAYIRADDDDFFE